MAKNNKMYQNINYKFNRIDRKTLTLHFNHTSYVYSNVDVQDWNNFNNSESQGKALNEFIKGKYDYEKIHEVKDSGTFYVAGQKL